MSSITVSDLNLRITELLSCSFPYPLSVQGEISNLSVANSGHWYFTLKDDHCQIKSVMFRGNNSKIPVPSNGDKVEVFAQVSFYKERGDCQLICTSMTGIGMGNILAEIQRRKEKLNKEGLFSPERKQLLPLLPQKIGIVTSSTGAALQDILKIFRERAAPIHIYIFSCLVQGKKAGEDIAQKIGHATRFVCPVFEPHGKPVVAVGASPNDVAAKTKTNTNAQASTTHRGLDTIIVSRGGGSSEDLLSFSDEVVVRAIANSTVPIITGIGHETDISLADFAADVLEHTPTAAAVALCDHIDETHNTIHRIHESILQSFAQKKAELQHMIMRYDPRSLSQTFIQNINNIRQGIDRDAEMMKSIIWHQYHDIKQQALGFQSLIESASPDAILKKGFALVENPRTKKIITNAGDLEIHQEVQLRFHDNKKYATIK